MHVVVIGPAAPREFAADLGPGTVAPPIGLGGSTVNQLMRSLLDLGHRVTLVTTSPDIDAPWRAAGDSFAVVAVPQRQRARTRIADLYRTERRAMAAELRRIDADVFHAHWTYEFAGAAMAAGRRPLLVTAHDSPWDILRTMPDLYRLGRLLLALRVRPGIRDMTAVSPYLARRWRRTLAYRRPIRIVPNAVPGLAAPPRTVGRVAGPILLEIADDSRRKNIPGLLRAFRLISGRLPGAELRLVGAGLDDAGPLAARARQQGLGDGVVFLGSCSRQEVAQELADADLLVHASFEESQGLSMLEALSVGVPVVAGSDSGGVAWTMLDGAAARLVDVRDDGALADAVVALLADRSAQRRTVAAGQEALRTRYAPTTVAGQYLERYRELIAGG